MKEIQKQLSDSDKGRNFMSQQYDDILRGQEKMKEKKLVKLTSQNKNLSRKVLQLEQELLDRKMGIHGLEETNNENLREKFCNVMECLGVGNRKNRESGSDTIRSSRPAKKELQGRHIEKDR